MPRTVRALLVAWPLLAAAAGAQQRPADTLLTVARFLDYETVANPQIAQDGARVIYARGAVNKLEDKWDSALWIVNADGSRNRFFTKGSSPIWSPDGTRVAYLADGEPKGTQVFVKYVDQDGPATQVTRVTETPGDIKWSPDGKSIGFTMSVAVPETWKIDMPAAPEGAKWTKAPRYTERLHYRADRRGFTEAGSTQLFMVSADGGTPRQVTGADLSVGARFDALPGGVGWDWTPDGKTIVVEAMRTDEIDRNYRDSDLWAVTVATGAATKLTTKRGTWSNPTISPDGKQIAFTGAEHGDYSYRVLDLYTMNVDGSGMALRSQGLDRQPANMEWTADGGTLYFTADDRGSSALYAWTPKDGVKRLTDGSRMLGGLSISRTGEAAAIATDPKTPPDVIRFPLKRPTDMVQLTHVNDDLLAGTKIGDVEEIWYGSTSGTKVQGWIVKPPAFDPSKKYPMMLEIHGGPHGMYNRGFNYRYQAFAANGYVVLYVNPRGSTGYGSAFGNAIERAYPGVDYDDLMAGVDEVQKRGYVDTSRLFVAGCSGGGVLTSWTIGHTDRFAAAAVLCPVTDWLSMTGHTDIPFFTYNFFPKPFWEDPKPWLERSPLMYVGNVKTPTVLMTGDLDMRTPMPQTEEYYSALKYRGVPSALLRFDGEYHGTSSKPSNWLRTQLYMMSWFDRWGGKKKTDVSAQ